jgi:hypothetical protein
MNKQIKREIPTYYALIPAEVRYCKDIPFGARLLFGEIMALANKSGYCWASNDYFGELYDVHQTTITEWIAELKRFGFINFTIKGNNRKITVIATLRKKTCLGKPKDLAVGKEKDLNNNTSNNNKNNISDKHVAEQFSFSNYISGVLQNSKESKNWARYFAAYFLKRKGLTFNSAASVEGAMKRHYRAAKELGQFTGDMDKIKNAFTEAENLVYHGQPVNWGLETVVKQLTK